MRTPSLLVLLVVLLVCIMIPTVASSHHTKPSLTPNNQPGGKKYLVGGLFFKLAQDTTPSMYGGHENAMKAAGTSLITITIISIITTCKISTTVVTSHMEWCRKRTQKFDSDSVHPNPTAAFSFDVHHRLLGAQVAC